MTGSIEYNSTNPKCSNHIYIYVLYLFNGRYRVEKKLSYFRIHGQEMQRIFIAALLSGCVSAKLFLVSSLFM